MHPQLHAAALAEEARAALMSYAGTAPYTAPTTPRRQLLSAGGTVIELPRLVASSEPGNPVVLIRLLAQIAARQATAGGTTC